MSGLSTCLFIFLSKRTQHIFSWSLEMLRSNATLLQRVCFGVLAFSVPSKATPLTGPLGFWACRVFHVHLLIHATT